MSAAAGVAAKVTPSKAMTIKKVDPELYDLIIRYFPTDKWDFCK